MITTDVCGACILYIVFTDIAISEQKIKPFKEKCTMTRFSRTSLGIFWNIIVLTLEGSSCRWRHISFDTVIVNPLTAGVAYILGFYFLLAD